MSFPSGAIVPLLFPGGLLFGMIIWVLHNPPLALMIEPFIDVLFLAIVAAAFFFGWRFNRCRLLYALALLVLTDRLLCWNSAAHEFIRLVAGIALPLNLAVIVWFGERGMLTGRGIRRWMFFAFQIALFGWLYHRYSNITIDLLNRKFIPWPVVDLCPLPHSVQGAFVLAFVLLLFRYGRYPKVFEGCFIWATIAALFAIAQSFIAAPVTPYIVCSLLILLVGVVESSHSQAFRDELTGLPGRRSLNEALLKLGSRYVIAMVDIDHFKKFNDTYGHDVGDQVLRMVAESLRVVRGGGRSFRYGGEEFAIIFRGREMTETLPYLEALREEIATSVFILRGKDRPQKKPEKPRPATSKQQELRITVSIGVAQRSCENNSPEEVIKAADDALYRAKSGGRNQVAD